MNSIKLRLHSFDISTLLFSRSTILLVFGPCASFPLSQISLSLSFFYKSWYVFEKDPPQNMRCKVFTPNSTGPESRGIFNMPRAGVVGFICHRKHIHPCEHFIVNHLTMRAIVRSFQHSQWWICYRRECRAHPNTQIRPVGKLGYNTAIVRLVLSS